MHKAQITVVVLAAALVLSMGGNAFKGTAALIVAAVMMVGAINFLATMQRE